jgi:hypothetical protein
VVAALQPQAASFSQQQQQQGRQRGRHQLGKQQPKATAAAAAAAAGGSSSSCGAAATAGVEVPPALARALRAGGSAAVGVRSAVVFVSSCKGCVLLEGVLRELGLPAASLHSGAGCVWRACVRAYVCVCVCSRCVPGAPPTPDTASNTAPPPNTHTHARIDRQIAEATAGGAARVQERARAAAASNGRRVARAGHPVCRLGGQL